MCVNIDKEIAMVGFVNEILYMKKIESTRSSEGFSIDQINGTMFSINTIIEYCNHLHYANCGPVIKSFDKASLQKFINEKELFFEKTSEDKFVIKIDEKFIDSSGDVKKAINEFKRALINEFNPEMNYPSRFMRFLKLS